MIRKFRIAVLFPNYFRIIFFHFLLSPSEKQVSCFLKLPQPQRHGLRGAERWGEPGPQGRRWAAERAKKIIYSFFFC